MRGQVPDRVGGSGGAAAVALPRRPVGFVLSRLVHGGGRALGRGLALLLMGLMLAGCGQSWEWHEKITVEVETPEGIKRASSVLWVEKAVGPRWLAQGEWDRAFVRFKGEAVVLELKPGRYLFVLLNNFHELDRWVFDERAGFPSEFEKWAAKMEKSVGMKLEVPREYYPLLVTFDDINDPKTVRRVDPDDLAATFGPGYRLKSITIEITDEPVTRGKVEKVLGWLGKYPEPKLGPATGRTTNIPFYRKVSHGDFIRK